MKYYALIAAAAVYFTPQTSFAKMVEDKGKVPSIYDTAASRGPASEVPDEPENIELKRDLATHLGLTQQDVLFGKPRNFRSDPTNSVQLDPLPPSEPAEQN